MEPGPDGKETTRDKAHQTLEKEGRGGSKWSRL